jgi:hypothetical protein
MEPALEQLLLAFAKADRERINNSGGQVAWEDIQLAFEMAREALPGRYLEIVRELNALDARGPLGWCDASTLRNHSILDPEGGHD